jgi:hypothetical protein
MCRILFSKNNTSYNIFIHCLNFFFIQEIPWSSAVERDILPLLQLEVSSEWFHLAPRDILFVGRRKLLVMDSPSHEAYPQNGYLTTATLTTPLTHTTALITAATPHYGACYGSLSHYGFLPHYGFITNYEAVFFLFMTDPSLPGYGVSNYGFCPLRLSLHKNILP